MRLTCPTCETVYEVPRGQLPETGRHVQCSTCHTRWFARPPLEPAPSEDQIIYRLETRVSRAAPVMSVERSAATGETEEPAPTPAPAREAVPEAAAEPVQPAETVAAQPAPDTRDPEPGPTRKSPEPPADDFIWEASGPETTWRAPSAPPRPAPAATVRARPIDTPSPAVVQAPAALREEPPGPPPRPAAPKPGAEMRRGELAPPPPPRPSELPAQFGRGDLPAPEVTRLDGGRVGHHPLRLEVPGAAGDEGWDREGRLPPPSRFGRGLLVALVLFAAALALYGFEGAVVAQVPALAPVVDAYVGAIDQVREALAPVR